MADDAYQSDLHAWSLDQATALRERGRGDNRLDWDNLAEEIESLGASERRSCESYVERIVEHLLKLQFLDTADDTSHHRIEVGNFRIELVDELTPSLARLVPTKVDHLYAKVLSRFRLRFRTLGQLDPLPPECPYSWDDILGRGEDWTPDPRPSPD